MVPLLPTVVLYQEVVTLTRDQTFRRVYRTEWVPL